MLDARGERVVPLLCPFDLQVWTVDRMLNFEIADDPDDQGLELQVFDDPAHGTGMIADQAGRVIEVRIDDRDGRRRRRGALLAPVGSAVERPVSLSLFVMGGCDLVRRAGLAFDIRIGGRMVTTGRPPGAWLHRRRLVKDTADPTVVVLNRAHDGPVVPVRDRVDLVLDVTRGWRPRRLPPLMASVTRIAPVFRTWPTTYRWSATMQLGDQPTLRSRWERTGDRRDHSYRRLTR